jgi:hypothetical protein
VQAAVVAASMAMFRQGVAGRQARDVVLPRAKHHFEPSNFSKFENKALFNSLIMFK